MYFSPPRDHEWRTDVGDLVPVEGDDPHTEARYSPKELVYDEVICGVTFVSRSIPKLEKTSPLGAIQHAHEKKDKPRNKKPGKIVHRNTPVMTYKKNR